MITIHHNFDPEQFEWLWAKYVNGGNVSQHCFPCLKGKQSKKFSKAYNPDMGNHPVIDMDETPDSDYDAVYFCGVSKKGYIHNVHLVVRPSEGNIEHWKFDGWDVEIQNGTVDMIPCAGELKPEYFNAPYDEHYYTCRNFLWMVGAYYPEALDFDKLTIRCVKDSDGRYDTDQRIPISLDEWRTILRDIAENDINSWNLIREFHKAKDYTAYVRDVAANLKLKRTDIINRIDALGLLIAGSNGKFRIVRRLNPRSECWWPVFFNMQFEEASKETIYTLRHDLVIVMDEMTKTSKGGASSNRESKGTVGYPTFYFFEMGLNVGDVLTFVPDPSIIATVATNRKVICNGKETYLTPLTTELRGKNGRMGKYWTFNGKTIDELYYETYFPNGKTFEEYQAEVEEKRKQQDGNI